MDLSNKKILESIESLLKAKDTELKSVLETYNYIFGYVTVYWDEFFKHQDRELPWAMIAAMLHNSTGNYYMGIGSSHLSKIDYKEGYEAFMKEHEAGFNAWKEFVESKRY